MNWGCPASIRTPAASSRPCTAAGCGRCGSTPGFGTAEESNARYRYLLAQGVSGLSVAFDLPTQMGYDSDHPLAAGEVGRVGVAIDSLEDMAALFDGIPARPRVDLDDHQFDGGHPARALRRRGAPAGRCALQKLSGTIQNDILKEYVARGTYIFPPRHSLRIVTDIFAFCSARAAQLEQHLDQRLSHPGGRLHRRCRKSRSRSLMRSPTCRRRSMPGSTSISSASDCRSSSTPTTTSSEEIAKFRAARRLWASLMRDRFGATNPRAQQLRFHTQTAGSTLTAQQPDNNIVRVAVQALAAVMGGTQSLHCNGFDEALALPTEESARLALRTQQIIAAETGVVNTVDPLRRIAGVEQRTDEIERGRCRI